GNLGHRFPITFSYHSLKASPRCIHSVEIICASEDPPGMSTRRPASLSLSRIVGCKYIHLLKAQKFVITIWDRIGFCLSNSGYLVNTSGGVGRLAASRTMRSLAIESHSSSCGTS